MIVKEQQYIDIIKQINKIYAYLEDNLSKDIFKQRILYNIDDSHIENFIKLYSAPLDFKNKNILKIINEIPNEELFCIWGLGIAGKYILNHIEHTNNIIICDKNHDKIQNYNNIPVISPAKMLEKCKNMKIFISDLYREEMMQTLLENDFNKENIYFSNLYNIVDQYFDQVIQFSNNEIFLDVGAFDGLNSINFIKHCKNYKKIYMFEPDEFNLKRIENKFKSCGASFDNITVYPYAIWNKEEVLEFDTLSIGSKVTTAGGTKVLAQSLDALLLNEAVTFIKMDIEGAELKALQGAQQIIKKYKPKLAISVYHKPEDIILLLEYIKLLVPEYKFYLRHYSAFEMDTVLYAIL